MTTTIRNLIRQPATHTAAEFFALRAARAQAVAELDAQIETTTREINELCAAPPAKTAPAKLGILQSTLSATKDLRRRAADDLVKFDAGFERAASALVGEITKAREDCLWEIAGLIVDRIGVFFGNEADLGPNERDERRQNIDGILPRTVHMRAEHGRHFPIRGFADFGTVEKFLPALELYHAELGACRSRLAAIKEMRAGDRPLSVDLSEFEHPRAKQSPARTVSTTFDPPEPADAFAARRAAKILQYEHKARAAMREGISPADLDELGGVIHPDDDPNFRRFTGSK